MDIEEFSQSDLCSSVDLLKALLRIDLVSWDLLLAALGMDYIRAHPVGSWNT